jgi:putative ABC transport system permease protein
VSSAADASAARENATVIGTWYKHGVAVPDGTTFETGVSATHPWWKIDGAWFDDAKAECVVGTEFAAKYPAGLKPGSTIYVRAADAAADVVALPLTVTGIVTTGDAQDAAVLVPLRIAQQLSGHPGQFRELFVSALTKPADALAEKGERASADKNVALTPAEYDRWFCSPYISSISFQIRTVLPGTEVRTIRKVADSEGRILSRVSTLLWIVTLAALIAAALGVAATSATTVLERRAEIGVMKALGASTTLVNGIFLAEQLLLAVTGGVIGFALGAVLARALGASVFGTPASPRLVLVPVVVGLAALVAIVGSLVPLRRASQFEPAMILRGE